MEKGTVKAVLIKATSGSIIYETIPEKVTSHYGVPTSAGMKHGITYIVEEKIKEISLTAANDFFKNLNREDTLIRQGSQRHPPRSRLRQ